MSHLIVVAEVPPPESDAEEPSEEPDEERPLLGGASERRAPAEKRQEVILTETFNLLPDFTLSHQVRRHRADRRLYSTPVTMSVINNTVVIARRNH